MLSLSSGKVEKIEYLDDLDDLVFDITVEDNHNLFVCNNKLQNSKILVHNCLEENWKFINNVPGIDFKPFSLEANCIRRGFFEYGNTTIAKDESKNIANKNLDDELLLRYMAYDVLTIFYIIEAQKAEAKFLKYTKYESVVSEQISDMIHVFSAMNSNGIPVDVDYLLYLNSKDSPILKELKLVEHEVYSCKEAKALNSDLIEEANIPTQGLFGSVSTWLFDIHKRDHKTRFFFDYLKLKPLKLGKPDAKGKQVGKIDKEFQEKYKENKIVSVFTKLAKAEKLRDSFVKSFIKFLKDSADFKLDFCIRPFISFAGVVTGRVSEKYPNCQQIPSRSELGKHIKRLFTAKPGELFVKVDYNAHEVRGLAIVSGDKELSEAFLVGMRLRDKYKRRPSKELREKIDLEGDVHKMNASNFFSKKVKDITKELRNAIKSVVFGLIYGKGNKALSRDINQPMEFVEDLVKKFFKRFSKGGEWLSNIEKFAQKHHWVESPIGRRRNLTAYLLPKQLGDKASAQYGAMDRRARNSPIQGMGSDFGFISYRRIDRASYARYRKTGVRAPKICNTVHDSLETLSNVKHLIHSIKTIQYEMTKGVEETVYERHKFKFILPLEIEFEIGPTLRDSQTWDWSLLELLRIVAESLAFQKYKLNYPDIEIKNSLKHILTVQKEDMPDWMLEQYKFVKDEIDIDKITKKAIKTIKESKYK